MSDRDRDDSAPNEETQRLNPLMVAATARAADAKARANEALPEEEKETPRAPEVAESKAKETRPSVAPPAEEDSIEGPKKDDATEKTEKTESSENAKEKPKAATAPASTRERVVAWAKRNVDPLIGTGIGATYVGWLLATARSLGFSRDEGFYFSASAEYERWFKVLLSTPGKALERAVIDPSWSANHEHPSLMKSLFGLSHLYLFDKWKIFHDQSTAFRFPGMLMMGLALAVTYLFAAQVYSRRAGIVAAITLGLMPNVFYHAHLACFDVPIMAMWITCVYVYWRAEKRGGIGPALLAGIVYGLTLETKHNAWMLPAVFIPHAFFVHGRAMGSDAKSARLSIPLSLVAMATVGPAVFVLLWPWLWNDTIPRIQEYVNFHVHHEYYNIEFLGTTYFGPPSPRSYMPVMIAATVPTTTLLLFVIGAFDRLRVVIASLLGWLGKIGDRAAAWLAPNGTGDDPLQTDLLLFLALAAPLGAFLLPRTPIFGGTKHWITAYPALAIFAGHGFDLVSRRIEALLKERTQLDDEKRGYALALVGALTLVAPFAITRHSHPFGLSAYVPFFGGTAGGADLGLNRQFWGFTTQSLGPWFEKNSKPGDTVYIMDTAWQSWARMVDEKRIPPWLRGVGSPAEAELSMVHHEQHINEVDYNIWTEHGKAAPEYVLVHDGVPIISVYRRPHNNRPTIPMRVR